jgi:RimJ/RimL family protein N-acetyltransferase
MTTAAAVGLARWQALDADDRDAVRGLALSAEQLEFAGPVERAIAACEAADPALVAGLAIRAGTEVVGWLTLKRGAAAPDWADGAVVVGGLRIASSRQGRGLGAMALDLLPAWVAQHWPGASRLLLRVDDGNAAGIRAYEKAGWTEVGERRVGRVGVERTMALAL